MSSAESAAGGIVSKPIRRRGDLVIQLNTRVSLASRDLIDAVVERDGLSIRDVIEQALESRWGSAAPIGLPPIPKLRAVNRPTAPASDGEGASDE